MGALRDLVTAGIPGIWITSSGTSSFNQVSVMKARFHSCRLIVHKSSSILSASDLVDNKIFGRALILEFSIELPVLVLIITWNNHQITPTCVIIERLPTPNRLEFITGIVFQLS